MIIPLSEEIPQLNNQNSSKWIGVIFSLFILFGYSRKEENKINACTTLQRLHPWNNQKMTQSCQWYIPNHQTISSLAAPVFTKKSALLFYWPHEVYGKDRPRYWGRLLISKVRSMLRDKCKEKMGVRIKSYSAWNHYRISSKDATRVY